MKKLNKWKIKQIRELYEKGNITQRELAEKFNVSQDTIRYHLDKEYREQKKVRRRKNYAKLDSKRKKELYEGRKEYQKNYRKERYDNDPEFRQRVIELSLNYKSKQKNA